MSKEGKEVIAATIGGVALIISALITGFFSSAPTRISIQATQTAEAFLLPLVSATPTPAILPAATSIIAYPTYRPSQVTQSTPSPYLKPTEAPPPESAVTLPNTIPFRRNELLLAITGILLVFGLVGIFQYLPNLGNYLSFSLVPRLMVSFSMMAPFILIWLGFFFSVPQNVPLALVLFVAFLDLAIILWFAEFFFTKLKILMVILLGISPIYITAFGFTQMSVTEAFVTASLISGCEILYVIAIDFLHKKLQQ